MWLVVWHVGLRPSRARGYGLGQNYRQRCIQTHTPHAPPAPRGRRLSPASAWESRPVTGNKKGGFGDFKTIATHQIDYTTC
eukprot:7114856-Prymnesium_polylepis.2